MEKQESSYYAVIPMLILHDKRLKPNAKILYGQISGLTTKYGYCYATNNTLGEYIGISPSSVKNLLEQLEKFGYISRETIKNNEGTDRKIYLRGVGSNDATGGVKQLHEVGSNDAINNKVNNKLNNYIYTDILDFWNKQNITVHKTVSNKTVKTINKLLLEFSLDDIKKGIANYSDILKNKNTFFKYKWTLEEFLQRGNGFRVFLFKTVDDYLTGSKVIQEEIDTQFV